MAFHSKQEVQPGGFPKGLVSGVKQGEQKRTRREFLSTVSNATAACLLGGLAFSIHGCGGNYSPPPPPPGDGYPGTDDQLLEEIEKAAFLFFWEQADPNTGQVKDRALVEIK